MFPFPHSVLPRRFSPSGQRMQTISMVAQNLDLYTCLNSPY